MSDADNNAQPQQSVQPQNQSQSQPQLQDPQQTPPQQPEVLQARDKSLESDAFFHNEVGGERRRRE